jgi:hypothetical protein
MRDGWPEETVAAEDLGGHGTQRIELVVDRDDLPPLETEMFDRHLLPVALVGSRALIEPERDGNGIREAALPREVGGKGEERGRVPSARETDEAGGELQPRNQEISQHIPDVRPVGRRHRGTG